MRFQSLLHITWEVVSKIFWSPMQQIWLLFCGFWWTKHFPERRYLLTWNELASKRICKYLFRFQRLDNRSTTSSLVHGLISSVPNEVQDFPIYCFQNKVVSGIDMSLTKCTKSSLFTKISRSRPPHLIQPSSNIAHIRWFQLSCSTQIDVPKPCFLLHWSCMTLYISKYCNLLLWPGPVSLQWKLESHFYFITKRYRPHRNSFKIFGFSSISSPSTTWPKCKTHLYTTEV